MPTNENILTKSSEKAREVLRKGYGRFQDQNPTPFGASERSRRLIRQDFETLTPQKVEALVSMHGRPAVNRWLGREMKLRERRERMRG